MTDLRTIIQESIRVPAVLESVIETANTDLYHGPVYFDADGNHVEMFDGAVRQFDFQRATEIIGNWLNDLPTYYYVDWWPGIQTDNPDDEYPEIDSDTIAAALVGRELSTYL